MIGKCIDYVCVCLVLAGLLIAGCECEPPLWPWTNLAGVAAFGVGVLILNRRSKHAERAIAGFRQYSTLDRAGVFGYRARKNRVAAKVENRVQAQM